VGVSRIFWDTNLFIYLFEDYGQFSERVASIRQRMLERGDELLTSTLTLGEVLVKPSETGNTRLKATYEEAVTKVATLLPFSRETARLYADIRRDRSIRAPDAIQLACAAQARVDLFLTNDDRLAAKTISGIQFIQSVERGFL
jgi:predicted nucleic acid-binding protein